MANLHIGYHRYHEGRTHHPTGHYITTIPNTQHTGHFHGSQRGTLATRHNHSIHGHYPNNHHGNQHHYGNTSHGWHHNHGDSHHMHGNHGDTHHFHGNHDDTHHVHGNHVNAHHIHGNHGNIHNMHGNHGTTHHMHGTHGGTHHMHGTHGGTHHIHGTHGDTHHMHGTHGGTHHMHGTHGGTHHIHGTHGDTHHMHGTHGTTHHMHGTHGDTHHIHGTHGDTHHIRGNGHVHGNGHHHHDDKIQTIQTHHKHHIPMNCGTTCTFNTCCCHNEQDCGYNYGRAYYCDHAGGHDCGLVLAVDKVPRMKKPKMPELRTWREYPKDEPQPKTVPSEPMFRWDRHLGRTCKIEQTYKEIHEESRKNSKKHTEELASIMKHLGPEPSHPRALQPPPRFTDTEYDKAKQVDEKQSRKPIQGAERPELESGGDESENRGDMGGVARWRNRPQSVKSTSSSVSKASKSSQNYPSQSSPYNNGYRPKSPYKSSVGIYETDVTGSNISRHMQLESITRSTIASSAKQQPSMYVSSQSRIEKQYESEEGKITDDSPQQQPRASEKRTRTYGDDLPEHKPRPSEDRSQKYTDDLPRHNRRGSEDGSQKYTDDLPRHNRRGSEDGSHKYTEDLPRHNRRGSEEGSQIYTDDSFEHVSDVTASSDDDNLHLPPVKKSSLPDDQVVVKGRRDAQSHEKSTRPATAKAQNRDWTRPSSDAAPQYNESMDEPSHQGRRQKQTGLQPLTINRHNATEGRMDLVTSSGSGSDTDADDRRLLAQQYEEQLSSAGSEREHAPRPHTSFQMRR